MTAWGNEVLLAIGVSVMMMASLLPVTALLGQFSLCHAALMGAGAYAAALVVIARPFGGTALADTALLFLALLSGGLCGALAGALSGLPALRLKGEHLTASTLAFGQILYALFLNLRPLGGYGLGRGTAGQSLVGITRLMSGTAACLLAGAALWLLAQVKRSRFARLLRIVKNDETAAQVVGIRVPALRLLCFAFSGFWAGFAGAMAACGIGTVSPSSFSYARSVEYAMASVLAGDRVFGVLFTGILSAVLPELLGGLASLRMLGYALAVLTFVPAKNKLKGKNAHER